MFCWPVKPLCFVNFLSTSFDICGSMHHHLINKTTNVMQLGAIVFIIPWNTLYVFQVLFTPIIRSVLKLYMQLLVQPCIGVRSGLLQDDQKLGAYSTAVHSRLLIIITACTVLRHS
jgi:hypothetical protein